MEIYLLIYLLDYSKYQSIVQSLTSRKYPQLLFPSSVTADLTPAEARIAIISYVGKANQQQIDTQMKEVQKLKI